MVLAVGMESSDISDLVEMMKISVGVDGFLLEVHPKLRPVELAQSGFLLAAPDAAACVHEGALTLVEMEVNGK